jgi:hypothetical protein
MHHWKDQPELIDMQKSLLEGRPPLACKTCVDNEKLYGRSLRTDSNRDYNHETFVSTDIDFVDFRSKNICNFKCRSCEPTFSHGIAKETNDHPELKSFFPHVPNSKTVSVIDSNVEWIMDNLGSLKRIMFTGGEPTVIPGVRDIIDRIKTQHRDVMVMITSNASFKDEFWFEITEELPKIHWTVSIDAVGPAAEIVRHGSDWSVIERNVSWLAQYSSSLDINSVVSNVSVFGLKPLLKFGSRMRSLSVSPSGRHGDQGCRHQFFVCQRPNWLAADNWPDDFKKELLPYLESCLYLDLVDEQINMVLGLLKQIQSSDFDQVLWNRTQAYNQTLDRIRQQDHLTLYRVQQ